MARNTKLEMFQVTDLDPKHNIHMTVIAILARRGCRKIKYSAMLAAGPGLDEPLKPCHVPLYIRKAAKLYLLEE